MKNYSFSEPEYPEGTYWMPAVSWYGMTIVENPPVPSTKGDVFCVPRGKEASFFDALKPVMQLRALEQVPPSKPSELPAR